MDAPDPALAEVVALERRLLDPEVRARPEEVARMLHAEFREFGASGREWTRAAIVEELRADPGRPTAMDQVRATRLGDGAVLVTYHAVPAAGPAARRPSLRSSIWVASAEGWRLLFHQGTRTGP